MSGHNHNQADTEMAVRRVLVYHYGGMKVGTYGDECLCGWEGLSWRDHVAPLLVAAVRGEVSS